MRGFRIGDPELDAAFAVLSDRSRRIALAHLAGRDDPPSVDALAAAVAERCEALSTRDARIALRHAHLPKLADAGYVVYDEVVELTDDAGLPLALLDLDA